MLREGAELLCIVQLNGDDAWEGLGPQWAGVALDQHLALGTCSLSQMLERLAQKRSSPEEQGLLGGPQGGSLSSAVWFFTHVVRKLACSPCEFPVIVWVPLALFLWDGLCLLLSPGSCQAAAGAFLF